MTEPVSVDPPVRRRRRWPIVAAVLVVVSAATAGAIWISRDDAPRVARGDQLAPPQPDLHWVLGVLPDGWAAFAAEDIYPGEFSFAWTIDGSYQTAMYGTSDDPGAPAMILAVGDVLNDFGMSSISGMYATIDMTRWSEGGTSGTCGSNPNGLRVCIVEVDGTTVQTHSSGLSADELQSTLMTLRVHDGMPQVDEASLVPGMVHLGSWRNGMPTPVGNVDGHTAVSSIQFRSPDGQFANMTIGRDDEQDLAAAFDLGLTEGLTVNGVTYYHTLTQSGQIEFVAWEQAGYTFQLFVHATDTDGLALARGVRPAEGDEWATAVTAARPDRLPAPTPTTVPLPAAPTYADEPTTVTDVDVTVTATARADGGGIEISSTAPDGSPLTLLVGPEGGAVGLDGQFQAFGPDGGFPAMIGSWPGITSWGAYVATADSKVWALRVTRANGDRYVAPLVPFPGRDDLRVAAVVVPVDEFVGADLVDEFGTVLDRLGKPAP